MGKNGSLQDSHRIWVIQTCSSQDYHDRKEQAAWEESRGSRQATVSESWMQRRKGTESQPLQASAAFLNSDLRTLDPGKKC